MEKIDRIKIFKDEFYYFLNKFKNEENFALLRFSDGELYMLQDRNIILDINRVSVEGICETNNGHKYYDKKTFNSDVHIDFKNKLMHSFLHRQENYYVGISCRCCVGNDNYNWQLEKLGGDHNNLTWSNVLLNSNYPIFMEEFYPEIIKRGAYIICNEHADLNGLNWVKHSFRLGTDSFTNTNLIDEIDAYIKNNKLNNEVFLFSASAFSNVAQYELFKKYPNNTYIDIGTTLSYVFKIPSNRGYLNEYYGNNRNYKTCIW